MRIIFWVDGRRRWTQFWLFITLWAAHVAELLSSLVQRLRCKQCPCKQHGVPGMYRARWCGFECSHGTQAKRSQREGKDDQGIFWGMQKSLRDRFLCSRIRMDKSDKRLFCFEIPWNTCCGPDSDTSVRLMGSMFEGLFIKSQKGSRKNTESHGKSISSYLYCRCRWTCTAECEVLVTWDIEPAPGLNSLGSRFCKTKACVERVFAKSTTMDSSWLSEKARNGSQTQTWNNRR